MSAAVADASVAAVADASVAAVADASVARVASWSRAAGGRKWSTACSVLLLTRSEGGVGGQDQIAVR
jgi:hypothetical protein